MAAMVEHIGEGKIASPVGVDKLAEVLGELIREKYEKDELADCALCRGVGPVDLGYCVFCGVGDEQLETEETRTMEQSMTRQSKGQPTKSNGKTKSTRDLDRSVQQIKNHKASLSICYWELGKLIADNHDEGLWTIRVDADGNQVHRTFAQFCRDEIGLGPTHATKLMQISRAFNKSDVTRFGTSKLGLVLQVPPEHRDKMLSAAADGAGKRDLEDMARQATGRDERPTAPAPTERVTVGAMLGKATIAFNMPPPAGKKTKRRRRAKADSDFRGAEAVEKMLAGVECVYRLQVNDSGGIDLEIERRKSKR